MAAISTIKNLGPVMETKFNAADVATAEDLRDMGADAGYAKLLETGVYKTNFLFSISHY